MQRDIKILIVCRGPIAAEALRVIHNIGIRKPDLVISKREWIDMFEEQAAWLSNREYFENIHRVDEYSDIQTIIKISQKYNIDAIYVGYGFLAENGDFARACEKHGITFIGPSPRVLDLLGSKENARNISQKLGIPVVPGTDFIEKNILEKFAQKKNKKAILDQLEKRANKHNVKLSKQSNIDDTIRKTLENAREKEVAFFSDDELRETIQEEILKLWKSHGMKPVRIKASAGGGGKGQRVVTSKEDIHRALSEVWNEIGASNVGSNKSVIIELNLLNPRHLEVQILGDGENVVHFGVRDCSIQTMFYQKLIEIGLHTKQYEDLKKEYPQNSLMYQDLDREQKLIEMLQNAAVNLCKEIGYKGAGTVEFLVDENYNFYFMEVNARLQVEHGVSEEISKVRGKSRSLIAEQIRIASGEKLGYGQNDITFAGYSLEIRISLLDSTKLQPAPGAEITKFFFAQDTGVRIEDGEIKRALSYYQRVKPPCSYDANIALNIYSGLDWKEVLKKAIDNLKHARIEGTSFQTTIPFHIATLHWLYNNMPKVRVTTSYIETYLCILLGFQSKLSKELIPSLRTYIKENSRFPKPWQNTLKNIFFALEKEPSLILNWIYIANINKPALEIIQSLADELSIELWPEEKEYFQKAIQFHIALEQLQEKLEISDNSLIHFEKGDKKLSILCKYIGEVSNVSEEKAFQTLKEKFFYYYDEDMNFFVRLFLDTIKDMEIFELKKDDKSTLLRFPKNFAKKEARKNYLDTIIRSLVPEEKGIIRATSLGVYYESATPGDPPYIQVGDRINKGQTLCLIGSMKVFCEIEAPYDGIVKNILVKNESLVSVGDKLIVIE